MQGAKGRYIPYDGSMANKLDSALNPSDVSIEAGTSLPPICVKDPTLITVERLLLRYLDVVSVEKKPASLRSDIIACRHFIDALGDTPLEQLQSAEIDRFKHDLANRPSAANRALSVLSHAWTCALRWGWTDRGSPVASVGKFREKRRVRHLSDDEYRRFLASLFTLRREQKISNSAAGAIAFLAFTGMRTNEVLTLQWSDLALEERVIRLRDSKTGPRVVPLNTACVSVLAWLESNSRWVFPGQRHDRPLVDIRRPWQRILRHAHIVEAITRHGLRHSFVSKGLRMGVPMAELAELCGHRSTRTTERYAHVCRDQALRASDDLARSILATLGGDPGT